MRLAAASLGLGGATGCLAWLEACAQRLLSFAQELVLVLLLLLPLVLLLLLLLGKG